MPLELTETDLFRCSCVKEVVIGTLTILSALLTRSFFETLLRVMLPKSEESRIWVQGLLAAFIIVVTVTVSSMWK